VELLRRRLVLGLLRLRLLVELVGRRLVVGRIVGQRVELLLTGSGHRGGGVNYPRHT
jgi:hypothetical protein